MSYPTKLIGDYCREGTIALQTGPFGSQLHSYDYVDDGVPVIPTEAIKSRRIMRDVLPKVSEETADRLSKHKLEVGDILFARRGAQATGQTAIVREGDVDAICGTGAIRLRVMHGRTSISPTFLSHFLSSPDAITWIKAQAIGATMPNLNEGIIKRIAVPALPIEHQERVAAALDDLDDKIELNRRMSATLEAIAQAIFRDWFVNFGPTRRKFDGATDPVEIMGRLVANPHRARELADLFPAGFGDNGLPEGWKQGTLGHIARAVGTAIVPSEIAQDTAYIGLEHMPRRSIALGEWEAASKVSSNKSAFRRGQILFGKLRPYFHKVGIAPVDGVCSTDIIVLDAINGYARSIIAACVSTDEFVAFTDQGSTGTKMPRTSWGNMRKYKLALATDAVVKSYSAITSPLMDKVITAIHENRALAATRDLLVPKLMSGEIRLRNADADLEAAQ